MLRGHLVEIFMIAKSGVAMQEAATSPVFRGEKACAFLKDHRCSIYDDRPLSCRHMMSPSAIACQTHRDKVNMMISPSYPFVRMGVDWALLERGLSIELVELISSVSRATADYDAAWSRWKSGGDPFPTMKDGDSRWTDLVTKMTRSCMKTRI
jgi:hypothetical protein